MQCSTPLTLCMQSLFPYLARGLGHLCQTTAAMMAFLTFHPLSSAIPILDRTFPLRRRRRLIHRSSIDPRSAGQEEEMERGEGGREGGSAIDKQTVIRGHLPSFGCSFGKGLIFQCVPEGRFQWLASNFLLRATQPSSNLLQFGSSNVKVV